MSLRRIAPALAIGFAFAASDAQAFFDPPWITPVAPRAGEPVFLNVRGGTCDVFVERPGYPQVFRNGNDIGIIEYGNRETFDDFCIYGIWTLAEPMGTFSPGSYTLTVDFTYENYPFGHETITLGVVPFAVVGAAPAAPVPAASPLWKFVSLVLISGAAARRSHAETKRAGFSRGSS
jgi:hypothetical protein